MPYAIVGGSQAIAFIYVKRGGGLSRLPRSRRNANPFGNRYQFRQGPNLHFRHHPLAMGLDGALGTTQREGDVLVGVAANDKFKDFPLTRRQCRDMSANDVQPVLQATCHFMMRNRPLDCLEKIFR